MENRNNDSKIENPTKMFGDTKQRKRYIYALLMILLMVGTAEILKEKEIIFPEMAALTIGMWIVDKRVWRIKRWQMPVLMTIGAYVGISIVRFSSLPLVFNLILAFMFAALCLLLTQSSLFPLISACILPVLLKTESWIYPLSVFIMSLIIVLIQKWMEGNDLRKATVYEPLERNWKTDVLRWLSILLSVFVICCLAIYTSNFYFIIPPLIVAYVEFVNSKAGFRNRPLLTILLLVTGALIGTLFQLIGYCYLGLPETVVYIHCVIYIIRMARQILRTGRSVGINSDAFATGNPCMVTPASCHRRRFIHCDRIDFLSAMLQMVPSATDLLPDTTLLAESNLP